MGLSRAIKKNNDEHILRIRIICSDTRALINEVEKALLKSKIIDTKAFKFIEDKKHEVDALCSRYSSHLEECTIDFIHVDNVLLDTVKFQANEIKASIVNFSNNLPETVRKNFPSYLLRNNLLPSSRVTNL